MNTIYKILSVILIVSLCIACTDDHEIGEQPSADEIKYSVTPSADNPNVIHFSFASDKMSPYWSITKPDGSVMNSNKRDFSIKYFMAGEYDARIQAYGGGGLSEELSFKFTVPENDPMIYKLSGDNGDKRWVWNSKVSGHLSCGWLYSDGPDWWITVPNELANLKTYDDELNFSLTDYKYVLNAHEYVYVDPSALKVMDAVNYPNGGSVGTAVYYIQPDNQKWAVYEKDDNKLYVSFSNNGFPSYVASPDALGAEYEILELTDDILYLKWNDVANETSWYYRFKVKSNEPEEPEDEITILTNYLTGKDTQKVWTWDNTTDGSLACGDISTEAPDWWITVVDELLAFDIYDDELSFIKTGNAYKLDAHGLIYVNPAALSTMDPIGHPDGGGDTAIPYVQPDGETWSLSKEGETIYLSFSSGAFPSYVADPAALGAKYEVLELTDSKLYLRWKDEANWTSWYYRFRVK
ncbi:hypothetical protein [Dysgonomonas sp.]